MISYSSPCYSGKVEIEAQSLDEAIKKLPFLKPGCEANREGSYQIKNEETK